MCDLLGSRSVPNTVATVCFPLSSVPASPLEVTTAQNFMFAIYLMKIILGGQGDGLLGKALTMQVWEPDFRFPEDCQGKARRTQQLPVISTLREGETGARRLAGLPKSVHSRDPASMNKVRGDWKRHSTLTLTPPQCIYTCAHTQVSTHMNTHPCTPYTCMHPKKKKKPNKTLCCLSA